jgi:hypothetical protein
MILLCCSLGSGISRRTPLKIDGLLGWDLIKEMRLELDGPAGELHVHDVKLEGGDLP